MSTNYISQITATNGTTYDISSGMTSRIFRATCSTAAATAAKVATLDDSTGYSLAAGVCVAVTFTYGNSAATPTLNVNSGGAKTIVYPSAVATNVTTTSGSRNSVWGAYETVLFTYNGTYWIMGKSSLAASHIWNGTGLDSIIENHSSNTASGNYSHAEGGFTQATGNYSHAEGYGDEARVTAGGFASHAEGCDTTASGTTSHAEGYYTTASGENSHAEGESTVAYGVGSHAEGNVTQANGIYSHAGGEYTVAQGKSQMAIGTYNILDSATTTTHPNADSSYRNYAFIIGNGTSEARSNALTVDWNGKLTVEGHNSPIGTIVENSGDTSKSLGASTTVNLISISLPPGVWIVMGSAAIGSASGNKNTSLAIGNTSTALNANLPSGNSRIDYFRSTTGSYILSVTSIVTNTDTTNKTCYLNVSTSVATTSSSYHMKAVRIA